MPDRRPRRRRTRRGVAMALLAGSALAATSLSPATLQASATLARAKRIYHPREGLTLTTTRYADGPVQVRVLEFVPKPKATGYTVEPGINGPVISSHSTGSRRTSTLSTATSVRAVC